LHAKYAILAARNGEHDIVEKPMALTIEVAQNMPEAFDFLSAEDRRQIEGRLLTIML